MGNTMWYKDAYTVQTLNSKKKDVYKVARVRVKVIKREQQNNRKKYT